MASLIKGLLSNKMQGDQPAMRSVTMFPQVNPLPGPQRQPATHDGNGEINSGERAPHMGGHIVLALGGMDEKRVAVGHKAGKEFFQVAPNVRVGVFLNEQRSRSVADVERQEAIVEVVLRRPGRGVVGEFVEAAAARGNSQFMQSLAQQEVWKGLNELNQLNGLNRSSSLSCPSSRRWNPFLI